MMNLNNSKEMLTQKQKQLQLEIPEQEKLNTAAKIKYHEEINSRADEVVQWVLKEAIPTVISNMRKPDDFEVVLRYGRDELRCSIPYKYPVDSLKFGDCCISTFFKVKEIFENDDQFIVEHVESTTHYSFKLTFK